MQQSGVLLSFFGAFWFNLYAMKNCFADRSILILVLVLLALPILSCQGVDNEPFTVVLLPDTQNYSEKYPETYLEQTRWVAGNIENENIRFVIHLGDIVQNSDREEEWRNADLAHRVFDEAVPPVPYSVVPGNHDVVHRGDITTWETDLFEKYFGPQRFTSREWYGGGMKGFNSSNYCFFEGGGVKFMVLSLNFAPGEEIIEWADSVLADHKNLPVILVTHAHLNMRGRMNHPMPYGLDGYAGVRLWENFIRRHENINLVLCGHVTGANRLESVNDFGKTVNELLFDYQGEENGGNGWLVKMRFLPGEDRIDLTTYSPILGRTWESPHHTFSLEYDFPGR